MAQSNHHSTVQASKPQAKTACGSEHNLKAPHDASKLALSKDQAAKSGPDHTQAAKA